MATYYIIDTKINEIINAVEATSLERAQAVVHGMIAPQDLLVTAVPPMTMLHRYRYYHERP
jgi:hypothetical protein